MSKLNGYRPIIIISLIGIVLILIHNPDWEKRCIKTIEKEKSSSLHGIVTKKFYVKGDMYPTIVVSTGNSKSAEKRFHAERSGIFDYLQEGDSISKDLNSLKYKIIRGDSIYVFKFTMFCNED
ncbi:MAG: hypothetical protein R2751_08060 [Bacteroidales bacterium]